MEREFIPEGPGLAAQAAHFAAVHKFSWVRPCVILFSEHAYNICRS